MQARIAGTKAVCDPTVMTVVDERAKLSSS